MKLTAATAQIAPFKRNVERNLDRIAEVAVEASREGADLLLLPETVVTGYFLEGGVLEGSLSAEELRRRLETRLGSLERPLDLALGYYEIEDSTLFNSAAYLEWTGSALELRHSYRKFFLPTYGVFDEERFVSRGRDLGVFETRFGTMALLICEDVWHSILPTLCALSGAKIILVPTASPARGFTQERPDNVLRYERMLRGISEEHGVFTMNAMLCGFEGGKGFSGGSMIVDPFGQKLVQAPLDEEHLVMAPVDLDLVALARAQTPLLSDLESAWGDIERLIAN